MYEKDSNKKAKISKDKRSIEYSRDEIETLLPNLAEELTKSQEFSENQTISKPEDPLRTRDEVKKAIQSRYDPDTELFLPRTEDFLRRCSTDEEAFEIIDYQLKIHEITEEQANKLRDLCKKYGVRHFGQKKEWGYYEKTYRTKRNSV